LGNRGDTQIAVFSKHLIHLPADDTTRSTGPFVPVFFRSTITEVIRQPLKGLFYGAMPIAWCEKGFWN